MRLAKEIVNICIILDGKARFDFRKPEFHWKNFLLSPLPEAISSEELVQTQNSVLESQVSAMKSKQFEDIICAITI